MRKKLQKRVDTLIRNLSLKEKVGQLFVPGYAGKDIEYAKQLIKDFHVGGFYLTEDNAETPEEACRLTSELNYEANLRACDAPLLLGVDHEGAWGVLVKYTNPGPGNLALGMADDPALTEQMYEVLAKDMYALGFNTIFGPCSDINTNPDNPIIGVRAFGSEPEHVSRHAAAAVKGLSRGKMISAAKHFPGHGDTGVDSHRKLPTVKKTLRQLKSSDLLPFQAAIDAGVSLIMTSHILYPSIDADNPATLSSKILRDILRNKMGFKGLIISDSMNMWAMRNNYTPSEAAVKALNAGVDLLMLSEEHYENQLGNYKDKQRETIEGVIQAVGEGVIKESTIDEALARVLIYKYSQEDFFQPAAVAPKYVQSDSHALIADGVAEKAIKVLNNSANKWPLRGDNFVLIGASNPELHKAVVSTRGIGPNEPVAAYSVFKSELEKNQCAFTEVAYEHISVFLGAERLIKTPVIIVTEDYPLPGSDYDADKQAHIVRRAIEKFSDDVIVIALRSHYELQQFSQVATYVCAYSSRACSARAAARELLNGLAPAGAAA